MEKLMGDVSPQALLERARRGDAAARGQLLDLYRNYLLLLARTQMGSVLRVRLEASDLVQDAMLEAHRDFTGFAGHTEAELLAWLRRVLIRNLLDQAKHHTAQARDGRRQSSLESLLDNSSVALGDLLAGPMSTPSVQAA